MKTRQSIPSPLQLLQTNAGRDALSARLITDLIKIHKQFLDKVSELDEVIKKKVGPKGDKGDKPIKFVDYFTKEEISQVVSHIISLIRIPKDGENGKTPTKTELLELIKPLIPKVKDGETPKKGIHYFTNEDIDKIVKLVRASTKKQKETVDPDSLLKIFTKEGKKVSIDWIDGFEQTLSARFHQLARGYLHGGGDTVAAGTNITLIRNANGTVTISSSGGGGVVSSALLTGAINSQNLSYTSSASPTVSSKTTVALIDSDNQTVVTYLEGVAFTRSGGNVIFLKPIDAVYSSYSLYLIYT